MIKKLNFLLTSRDKQFLFGLLLFSILISIVEVAGISVIMPFIAVATDFNLIHTNEYYSLLYNALNINDDVEFVLIFGVALIIFYIFRSIINLLYLYLLSKFTQSRYHLLTLKLFKNYMGLPYQEFSKRNSSVMTKSIINEAAHLTDLISAILFMVSEFFIVIFIYIILIYINYKITLVLTIVLVLNAVLMLKTVSTRIKQSGVIRAKSQKIFYEIINKSFGNFRLIKLQSNDKNTFKNFSNTGLLYAQSNIIKKTLVHVPRLFLEAIGFSIIISIILYFIWAYQNDIASVLSIITMFVLALYRLMPSVNRIMNSYNTILFYYKSLEIIYNDLMYIKEDFGKQNIVFNNEINIQNLNFEYEENKPILKNVNLTIKKGSKIAFIGESGSGKSTLVDIIIGLHKPKNGLILSDNKVIDDSNIKSWRSKIGYIPQSVYLFDGTVGENIVFGAKYNKEKVDVCLKKAKMYDFLNTKEGQKTLVGEGGIMLSGGQKQRIAIARALYLDPDILVLDEATSALDDNTEKQIMNEIYDISEDKTLIIIAHRMSTLERCTDIYKLKDGVLDG